MLSGHGRGPNVFLALVVTLVLAAGLLQPVSRVSADTAVSVAITSASAGPDGTATTDVFINGAAGSSGVGAYDFHVQFDKTKVNVVKIEGATPPFDTVPTNNIGLGYFLSNTTGKLAFNAYHVQVPGPTGNIKVATITWKVLVGGQHPLSLEVVTLADTDGVEIPIGSVVSGSLFSNAVWAGSAVMNVGTTAAIPVTVLVPPSRGLKSYAFSLFFNKTILSVTSVLDGDLPFGPPATKTIDNSTGVITLADSVDSGYPTGPVVVARLNVRALVAGESSLGLTVTQLKDSSGSDITLYSAGGKITVTTPAVKTASARLTPSMETSIPVSIEGLANQSLKSYDITIGFDKSKIKVNSVGDGTSPFGAPSTKIIDNNLGTVSLADSVSTDFPAGNVVVAYLNIQPLTPGASSLSIAANSLFNSAGGAIIHVKSEGTVTTFPTVVEVGSAFLLKGASADIPITIRQVPGLVGGKGGLGSYFFHIEFDRAKVRVNGFSRAGADPQLAAAPLGASYDNYTGQASVSQTLNTPVGPTGDVVVAKMNITALVEGQSDLTVADFGGDYLKDTSGNPIGHSRMNGAIVSVAVEAGSVGVRPNSTAQVPVTVKFPSGSAGLKAYGFTISFDKTKMKVDSVGDGDAPFGAPSTRVIDNERGVVTLADSQTGASPSGNIVVAVLNVTALAPVASSYYDSSGTPLLVNVTALTDTADRQARGIPGAGTSGTVTVLAVRVVLGSTYVVMGSGASIEVYIEIPEQLAPRGLKSYDLTVYFDNLRIKFNKAYGGSYPFQTAPAVAPTPVVGHVNIRGSHTQTEGPKGIFRIASIEIAALNTGLAGSIPAVLVINSLTDMDGNSLSAIPFNGVVNILPSGYLYYDPYRGAPPSLPRPTYPPPVAGAPGPPGPPGPTSAATKPTPAPRSNLKPVAPPVAGQQVTGSSPSVPAPAAAPPAPSKIQAPVEAPSINLKSDARDASGVFVPPTPGERIRSATVDGVPSLVIPVSVPRDTALQSFADPVSGVRFKDNRLTIPIRDSEGNLQMTLTVTTGAPRGTGSAAIARIEKVEIQTAPATVADGDSSARKASVYLKAELKSFPEGARINVGVIRQPAAATRQAMAEAVARAGNKIVDTALAMTVTSENLASAGPATVYVSVDRAWVDKSGSDKIAVVRQADDGTVEVLSTTLTGYADGLANFEAKSPGGLSTFALVALQRPPAGILPALTATAAPAPPPKQSLAPATPTLLAIGSPSPAPAKTPAPVAVAVTSLPAVSPPAPPAPVALRPQSPPLAPALPVAAGAPGFHAPTVSDTEQLASSHNPPQDQPPPEIAIEPEPQSLAPEPAPQSDVYPAARAKPLLYLAWLILPAGLAWFLFFQARRRP